MSDQWGPRYGDPSHPTTGELPRVGDGRTDEQRTIQVDTVADPPPRQESRSRYRYSWETSASQEPEPESRFSEPSSSYGSGQDFTSHSPSQPREQSAPRPETGFSNWSVPRVGRESSASGLTGEHSRPSLSGYRPGDTAQFARVGDGVRGSVGPVSVQVDHVRVDNGVNGDTQLLDTSNFRRPQPEEIPPAEQAPQPEPGTGSLPAMRHQVIPDWTQTPLRLLAAAVVATAVLGASAATLISIGNWINP
ncbi:hypothetical protein AB0K52_01350 [Glycomyces sp. NPDC049804]|uniref:hypothetical protein n=1 Tax=Glycomyces sp. NPDC049804 TaxID=3154363 RepID=UPI0034445A24